MQNKNFIEKTKKKALKNLKIDEAYFNTDIGTETINYLKEQKYIKFDKIKKVLKINFISDYPFGYVIRNQYGNIVGFMGTIFSTRNHNNANNILCNIHTWIVDKKYRINSFLLLTPLLEKNITMTAFTPVKTLVGLLEKLGFEKIKMKYRIVYLFKLFNFTKKNLYKIENDNLIVQNTLNQNDVKIYNNYVNLACEQFLIIKENETSKYIFVIATKIIKKGFQTLNLIHVSNNSELKKNWNTIKSEISKKFAVSFCSEYFFEEVNCSIPSNILLSKNLEKEVCIKKSLANIKLDILYSDLIE